MRWLLPLITAVLLAVNAHAAENAAKKAAELDQLRSRIGTLKQELQASRKHKTRAERDVQKVEQHINQTHRTLQKTERALGRLTAQLKRLQQQQHSASDRLHRQSAALVREARAAYAMGRQQQVKLLLNQEQPSAMGRMLVYFSYFSRARQAKIETIRDTLQQLDSLQADIQVKTRSLNALRDDQRQQAAQLRSQKQQREQVLARLNKQLSEQGGELKRLQADEKQLQVLVHSLQELLSDIPADSSQQKPFKSLKGRLRWPAQGRLAQRFGSRRGDSGLKWQGVLIAAPEGGRVRAVAQGRVAFADWLRGFGLLLIIDHGDGYMSLYGQNQALYKEVGEWVDSGEVVATLGASGGRSHAGLYFELRHNGQPVNPLRWCAGKPGKVSG
jgi:septal ring factor EnvC (AmiA/AmiB activator)